MSRSPSLFHISLRRVGIV